MEKTFCDGCGEQITEGAPTVAPLTIMAKEQEPTDDIEGDYCDDCAQVVREAVREAFGEQER